MIYYHFTCSHRVRAINASRRLKPMGNWSLIWLTDLPDPPRTALGLTSYILSCDRMEWRYTVDDTDGQVMRWTDYRRAHRPPWAAEIESAEGAMPAHWFVAAAPLAITAPGQRHAWLPS